MPYLKCYACDLYPAKYKSVNQKYVQSCKDIKCTQALENRNISMQEFTTNIPYVPIEWREITWLEHVRANLSWPIDRMGRWLWKLGFRPYTDWFALYAHRLRGASLNKG